MQKLPFTKADYQALRATLEAAEHICVVAHTSPDGDAEGSILAMAHLLKAMGKEKVYPILPDALPDYLQWLPGYELITFADTHFENAETLLKAADLIICMDFNVTYRTGKLSEVLDSCKPTKMVLIDHHLHPSPHFDLAFSFPPASSTAELLYHITAGMDVAHLLTKEAATCIMVGIITDTGCFNYNSSNPTLYEATAKLMEMEVDKTEIINKIYNQVPEGRLRLEGYVLNEKLCILHELGAAYFTLTIEEMNHFGMTAIDTDGLVNMPLRMKGVDCVCFFREDPHQIKLSIRSLGNLPTNKLASEHFRGGGHLNASGAEFQGTMGEAIERFVAALTELRKNYPITE